MTHRPGYNPALTPSGTRILELLLERESVTGNQIIQMLYDHDPDGGPLNANKCLSVHVHRLRWALRAIDVQIRSFDYRNQIGELCSYMIPREHREAARHFLEHRHDLARPEYHCAGTRDQLELFSHA